MIEIIQAIDNVLQQHIYIDFIIVSVSVVFILLKYVFPKKKENFRVIANIFVCAIGCFVFSYYWGYEVPRLIISSMSSVAFYQWIVKHLMNMFNVSYSKE
jgi:xanthine/uracil permease